MSYVLQLQKLERRFFTGLCGDATYADVRAEFEGALDAVPVPLTADEIARETNKQRVRDLGVAV